MNKTTNHWVGQSVMKPLYAAAFQTRKEVQEGIEKSKNTMKWRYFNKVHLEKAIDIKRKTSDGKQQWKTIFEVIYEN